MLARAMHRKTPGSAYDLPMAAQEGAGRASAAEQEVQQLREQLQQSTQALADAQALQRGSESGAPRTVWSATRSKGR